MTVGLLASYASQTATWKSQTGIDRYGQPSFASTTIQVRWDMGRKLYRDAAQQTVLGSGSLFCAEDVQVGDLVNDGTRDWIVLHVDAIVDINGNLSYREVTI
jgi:hypothetical protein